MRRWDYIRSVPADLMENTTKGGILTIIVILIAEILAISEIMWYFTTSYTESVGVGNSFNDKMDLYLDINLHKIACDQLNIQLWDKYQDKSIPIAGSSFQMTRVLNGELDDSSQTVQDGDFHHHDKNYLAKTMFEHAELERDWDQADATFNENTFKEQVDAHDMVFYMFYADWCPHSRALHKTWKEVNTKVDDKDIKDADGNILRVAMIQINCVPFETLCWEKDVTDYPTLRIYARDESYVKYDGEKKVDDIYKFVVESAAQTHHQDYWLPERMEEGCHLKGLLRLPRVPGHLKFSKHGKGHSVGWADLSHTVNSYTFLDPDDSISVGATGLETNPMHGKSFEVTDKKTAITHYATLVQTRLRQRFYGFRYVYQMSVLSVENRLKDKRKLSIRFVHDMFPMAVTYEFESKGAGHFIVRLLAILGGLYTVFNLIHGVTNMKKND